MNSSYDKLLSDKVLGLKPSGIRKYFDILDEMKGVISLTVGQPDFVTPLHIRQKGIQALEEGKTYYTSNIGMVELREEISNYLNRRFGLSYDPYSEMLVTVGGSEALDLTIRTLVQKGDEVIVIEPSFVCYQPLTVLADGVPVVITTKEKNQFKLTPQELEAALTPKTKLIIMTFPSNPTGAIMERSELEAIAEVVRDRDLIVASDEIYAELTYGKRHVSFTSLPGMKEKSILIGGFSKAYAMTGWRMGYACAPAAITEQMNKIHQYAVMCSPTVSQYAALEALKNGDADIDYMRDAYDMRRKYIVGRLRGMGIDCFMPQGAFYVFPNISKFGLSSEEFASRLLYEKKVAVVPGPAFGDEGEGFVRMSYAYAYDHIMEAMNRLEAFVSELKAENTHPKP